MMGLPLQLPTIGVYVVPVGYAPADATTQAGADHCASPDVPCDVLAHALTGAVINRGGNNTPQPTPAPSASPAPVGGGVNGDNAANSGAGNVPANVASVGGAGAVAGASINESSMG